MMDEKAREIGVALVGLGMVAPVYVEALADLAPSVRLRGVMSRSPESAAVFRNRNADSLGEDYRLYASLEEVAGDISVDLAILATPPDARREAVNLLADAGKHILMEKPVERTLEASEALCARCEAAEVQLAVMLQHRMRPAARWLAETLDSRDPGSLDAVEISVPWWRPQAYYDEPGRGSYARDGGGVLISQAIHTLDLALTFTGPVREVLAMSATTGFHSMEAEDFVSAGLRYQCGAAGSLFASTACYPGRTEAIRLHYASASATLSGNAAQLVHHDGTTLEFGADTGTGAGADPMAFSSDWHREMISGFVEAIRTGSAPPVSGRDALEVHRLLHALEKSAAAGSWYAVPRA